MEKINGNKILIRQSGTERIKFYILFTVHLDTSV